jgi:P-type Ca2+ transporter type 2C
VIPDAVWRRRSIRRLKAGTDTALSALTAQEAARQLAADGPNELPTAKRRNQETWDMIRQPMLLLLLLGAGLVNFLLAEPLDGTLLMAFVVVVIAISIYRQHKTEKALAAMKELTDGAVTATARPPR